jgi:beta-glucosidase
LRERIYVEGEEFEDRDPFDKIKAFNFDDGYNLIFNTKRNWEETYIIFHQEDSWILFQDLNFYRPFQRIRMEISTPRNSKIFLYFSKIDKEFSFDVIDTFNEWKEIVFVLNDNILGKQDMYIKGGKEVKINWFKFE